MDTLTSRLFGESAELPFCTVYRCCVLAVTCLFSFFYCMPSFALFSFFDDIPLVAVPSQQIKCGLYPARQYAGEIKQINQWLNPSPAPMPDFEFEVEQFLPLVRVQIEEKTAFEPEGSVSELQNTQDIKGVPCGSRPFVTATLVTSTDEINQQLPDCPGCGGGNEFKMIMNVVLPIPNEYLLASFLVKKKGPKELDSNLLLGSETDPWQSARNVRLPATPLPIERVNQDWKRNLHSLLLEERSQKGDSSDRDTGSIYTQHEIEHWQGIISAHYPGCQLTYIGDGLYQVVYSDGSTRHISLVSFIAFFMDLLEKQFRLFEGILLCQGRRSTSFNPERCSITTQELTQLYGSVPGSNNRHSDEWIARMARRGHFRIENGISFFGSETGCGFIHLLRALIAKRRSTSKVQYSSLDSQIILEKSVSVDAGEAAKYAEMKPKPESGNKELSPDELVMQPVSILLEPRYEDVLSELMKMLRIANGWLEALMPFDYRYLDVVNFRHTLNQQTYDSLREAPLREGRLVFAELAKNGMTILELLYRLHRPGWKGIEEVLYKGLGIRQYYPDHRLRGARAQLHEEIHEEEWVLRSLSQELRDQVPPDELREIAGMYAREYNQIQRRRIYGTYSEPAYRSQMKWFSNMLRSNHFLTPDHISQAISIIEQDHSMHLPPLPPPLTSDPQPEEPPLSQNMVSELQAAHSSLQLRLNREAESPLLQGQNNAASIPVGGMASGGAILSSTVTSSQVASFMTNSLVQAVVAPLGSNIHIEIEAAENQSQPPSPVGESYQDYHQLDIPFYLEPGSVHQGISERTRELGSPFSTDSGISSPRMSSPRMSSPRMSSPRMFSPRMSSPRMFSPRMFSSSPVPMEQNEGSAQDSDLDFIPAELTILSIYSVGSHSEEDIKRLILSRETLSRLWERAEEAARKFIRLKNQGVAFDPRFGQFLQ